MARGMLAVTRDRNGSPTPVTITGVQRRCFIDTQPDADSGYPGLYGNAFAWAPENQVRRATRALSPPTISNILAMAAPPGGYGEYSRHEIIDILTTAYTGFAAAKSESKHIVSHDARTIIHTGFWGCGAFGGNRTLMTMLQAVAGGLAGVDIVFWAFDETGVEIAQDAYELQELLEKDSSLEGLIGRMVMEGFGWGVSDGN